MAKALAKTLLLLYRLNIISFKTYDKLIDDLTVRSIEYELNKK